jgi:hypothetical protein
MILKLQLFSCLVLTGLIITIQFVHYPLWKYVSNDKIQLFEKTHQKLITPLVSILMILEGFTAFYLLKSSAPVYVVNFALLCGIWLSTFLLQVPMHKKILEGQDVEESIKKLIKTNYIRTVLWISRALLLTFFI